MLLKYQPEGHVQPGWNLQWRLHWYLYS